MATTTNYGWTTPDDTALVKDGAAAIRTLGSSVDTTTKALNPSTTLGDIEYRSSTANTNTRLPIGTSGQFLSVVGGVPAWAALTDQTPLTTKGDLFTFSTVDARLGVGANNTVLVADSAEATGLKWATPASGGMTLLQTISLSGASVTSSSIAGPYKDLRLIARNYKPATDGAALTVRINGDSGTNYTSTNVGPQIYGTNPFSETAWNLLLQQDNTATSTALGDMLIPDYANATTRKTAMGNGFGDFETTPATNVYFSTYKYAYNSTSAITSLTFLASSGNLTSGEVLIYGVN